MAVARAVPDDVDPRAGAHGREHRGQRLGLADRDERILIAPARPTYYPLLRKASPVWGIYFFWPDAAQDVQERMIRDLTDTQTRFALIQDVAVDDREDLRFRNSHPLVWSWLLANFERVPTPGLPPDHLLLKKKA